MGRQVIADVSLETYLKSLCKMQEIITGLIIGQVTGIFLVPSLKTPSIWSIVLIQPSKTSKDNVVHFARTPHTSETGKIESLSQVDVATFATHIADVLKMLPGGMFVLGVFVVGPKDVFADTAAVQKLKTLIVNLQQWVPLSFYFVANSFNFFINSTIKGNQMLLGDSDEFDDGEKLVLWYSSSNNSFTCKTFSGDSTKGAQLKSVDLKFHQKLSQNWMTFETFYKLDELLPIEDVEEASNEDVLTLPLKCLGEILHKSKVFFNGAPRDASEEVEKLTTDSKIVQAQIFRTCVSVFGT